MTSDYCHYLEQQLLDDKRKLTQLAEVAKNVTKVKEKLREEEKNTESLKKAYNDLKKNFKKAESELRKLKLNY